MTDSAKIRRNISLDLDTMIVRIAEHTGTMKDENYSEIHAVEYDCTLLNETISKHAMLHGVAQKLADSTASMSDAKGFTTTERFDVINDLFDRISGEAGEWNKRSEGGGTKLSQKAIANKMNELGLSPEQFEMAKQLGLIKA